MNSINSYRQDFFWEGGEGQDTILSSSLKFEGQERNFSGHNLF